MSKLTSGIFAVVTAALLSPLTVYAEVEEVVVTAQKREQRLQDVAVAVTALSAQTIEEGDIHNLEGIASRTPMLNFAPFSPGQNIVTLRGAGSNDDGAGTDSSVSLFLDEVYLGRVSNIDFEMADLERVEVLRGPQGTLYGKNTIGGAINLISRKPSVETSFGSVTLTLGNYDLRHIVGYYSTPLSDKWAIKLSGSSRIRDGWVNNVLRDNDNLKNQNAQTVRAQVLYQGSRTSLLMTMDANYLDAEDMGRIPIAGDSLATYLTDTGLTTYDRKTTANPVDGFAKRNAGGYSLKVDHAFNDRLSLDYILGIRRSVADWEMDSIGSSFSDEDLGLTPENGLNDNVYDKTTQSSSELRVQIAGGRWNTTVGLWNHLENTKREECFDITPKSDCYEQDNETISGALFAQTEVAIGRMFYITFGGRFSSTEKSITSTTSNGIPDFIIGVDLPNEEVPSTKRSATWTAFTPKLTLGLRINENHHVYLDYATGFKSGGFPAAPTSARDLEPIKQEGVTSIELGYKGSFSDSTSLNLVLFSTAYVDLQYQHFGPDCRISLAAGQSCPPAEQTSEFGFFRTINASDASISGGEIEFKYMPSKYFSMGLMYTFNDSKYEDAQRLHTGHQFSGKQMLHVPETKYSIMLGGNVPTSGGHTFRWMLDYRFEDGTLHDLTNDLAVSPAHGLLDVRLAWLFPQGFELSMWSRNALDETWIHHIYSVGAGTIAVFGTPVTYGASLKYSF